MFIEEQRKRRADFEQRMRDVKMEFETQKKLIELEGREGHFTRACLDKEVEDRLKAVEEAKAVEVEWKMEE
ncbi:UNVERIFIED_CONTAM: hypothetical protein NCL1_34733 [Trichonephila clavipes]